MRKSGKKLIAALLTGAMLLSVAGCGSSEGESGEKSTKKTEGGYNMTFIMPTRNEFNTAMEDGMMEYCEANGVNLVSQDANQDSSKLIQYVEISEEPG